MPLENRPPLEKVSPGDGVPLSLGVNMLLYDYDSLVVHDSMIIIVYQ